jgi:NAD(P)-dependent dehydrogenase (short-subunit alcohol dehydrogenase family)
VLAVDESIATATAAVAYLASCHADYVSGAVLRIDGGAIRSVN